MGTDSFPGVKYGRGVTLTTHPFLVPWSWKSRAIPLPTLGQNRACNGNTLPYITFLCRIFCRSERDLDTQYLGSKAFIDNDPSIFPGNDSKKTSCFYFLLTLHLSIILDNDHLDTQLLYFTIRLLKSSTCFEHYMLITRRLNCIDAVSGIVTLKISEWSRITRKCVSSWSFSKIRQSFFTFTVPCIVTLY